MGITHVFQGTKQNEAIVIEGSYDVNIWYSCLNDTKTEVATQHNTYKETVQIKRKEDTDIADGEEVIVRSLTQPNCIQAEIVNNQIHYTIEKELGIEVVGDTKVKIAIDPTEDPWDEIEDSTTSIEEQIEQQVSDDDIVSE